MYVSPVQLPQVLSARRADLSGTISFAAIEAHVSAGQKGLVCCPEDQELSRPNRYIAFEGRARNTRWNNGQGALTLMILAYLRQKSTSDII
jgi:hypothetical protein